MLYEKPIFFKENRVHRIYRGGKLFSTLKGTSIEDGDHPEEWLASITEAKNVTIPSLKEGLSIIENTNTSFKELISLYPQQMLGSKKWDILVKFLDSSSRLTFQVHPNKEQAKKYFNFENGKTELWIVLETRKDAALYYGMKNKISFEEFKSEVNKASSSDDHDYLVPLLNKIEVKKGDIFFIPANTVHAIGAGCLVAEIQEACDLTITPEFFCAGIELSLERRFLGLDEDVALSLFNLDGYGNEVIKKGRLIPRLVHNDNNFKKFVINDYSLTPYFASNQYLVKKYLPLASGPALYILLEGEATLLGNNYERKIKKGDSFFISNFATNSFFLSSDKENLLLECLPSQILQ